MGRRPGRNVVGSTIARETDAGVYLHDVTKFDQKDGVNILKGYMESGEFSRGKESIKATGGIVMVGNFDVDVDEQLREGHLLSPLPKEMRNADVDDRDVARIEAIIRSMTPAERDDPADEDVVSPGDTGMCNGWPARSPTPTAGRRVIGSFRHGSMANALPPPVADTPEAARPCFARVRGRRDELLEAGSPADRLRDLSMGMSHDFEIAVEEGATIVRVGTALFGSR